MIAGCPDRMAIEAFHRRRSMRLVAEGHGLDWRRFGLERLAARNLRPEGGRESAGERGQLESSPHPFGSAKATKSPAL